jgi:hypothetical protein
MLVTDIASPTHEPTIQHNHCTNIHSHANHFEVAELVDAHIGKKITAKQLLGAFGMSDF